MTEPTPRELTIRAILTGLVLGGLLSLCNVYAGLKIGWGFNMSITAALLSYGFWQSLSTAGFAKPWGKLENNINQTAASAGASISSAGLVAPIPALTMITGYEWSLASMIVWTFSVSLVGVVVAISIRRQMLVVDELPFPMGIATAETLNEMYARGKEAMARVKALLAGAFGAGGLKFAIVKYKIAKFAKAGIKSYSWKNLTFALDPSLLMVGVGVIIGIRAGASMLFGAVLAWLVIGPELLDLGWVEPGAADKSWFGPIGVKWLLWPGVVMMVTASLTSFAFSWRSVLNAMRGTAGKDDDADQPKEDVVPRKALFTSIALVALFSFVLQLVLFDIGMGLAALGIALTFALAIVAARVSGETGITPVGPMGKVTQLTFGAIDPSNVAANLMTANVTGGAASQAADLLHDMRCGLSIGASPRRQAIAQAFGVLSGAICGSAAYMVLVPDPNGMLLTDEWAAPAVAQWKAVAELFQQGIDALPEGAVQAMYWAAAAGIVLAILEKVLPENIRTWVPSPAAIGLAFVIPANYAISMFIGGLIIWTGQKLFETWTSRFMIVIAAGVVAGDSLVGMGAALWKILAG